MPLKLVSHPLVADRLGYLRDKSTTPPQFRDLLQQLGFFLFYEASRECSHLREADVVTPLGWTTRTIFDDKKIVLVPILRAGLGMLELILRIVPNAEIYHVGIYRDEKTLKPIVYYSNLSSSISGKDVFILDPMVATAGSVAKCHEMVKAFNPRTITTLCAIISPEGAHILEKEAPDMQIYAASLDAGLTENGYIYPGLGDAGDRYFGNVRT